MGAGLVAALHRSQHTVLAVLANKRKMGPSLRWISPLANGLCDGGTTAQGAAFRRRIPVRWIDRMDAEELAPLRAMEPDLLISGDYGIIFNDAMLALPRIGAINLHWSLLPNYRGPNPSTQVILRGEPETGLTFHETVPGVDEGDLLLQLRFPLDETSTPLSIYRTSCRLAAENIVSVVDGIAENGLVGTPQPPGGSYFRKLKHRHVQLDWERPAAELERLIRGSVSPTPWFYHQGRPVYVARSRVVTLPRSEPPGTVVSVRPRVTVATGDGGLVLVFASVLNPLPMVWPSPWSGVAAGLRIERAPDSYFEARRAAFRAAQAKKARRGGGRGR